MRPNTVQWFDSPEDYARYLAGVPRHMQTMYESTHYNNWSGGSWDQSLDWLKTGNLKNYDKAQALIDQMAEANLFSLETPVMQSSVIGFMPNVPNAILGQPNDMFNIVMEEQESLFGPLRIFVETTVSAGLEHKELIARGVCAMAFAMAMNMVRPVELYAASFGKMYATDNETVYGAIVRIPTNPIDLPRAVFMLTNPAYCRTLAFGAMHYQAKVNRMDGIPFPTDCRDLCKCEPHDVLIKGGHLNDYEMLHNPIAWVKKMVTSHTVQKDGDAT